MNSYFNLFYQLKLTFSFFIFSVVDAWGKLPSGVLNGDLYDLGDYDECLSISHNINSASGTFDGQFCLAQVTSPIPNAHYEFVEDLRVRADEIFRDGTNMLRNALRNGLRMLPNAPT